MLDCWISLWCTTIETGGQGEDLLCKKKKITSHWDVMKLQTPQLGKFGSPKPGGSSRSACNCPENVSQVKPLPLQKWLLKSTFPTTLFSCGKIKIKKPFYIKEKTVDYQPYPPQKHPDRGQLNLYVSQDSFSLI